MQYDLVRIQSAPFDAGAELSAFTGNLSGGRSGAIVSFTGLVRDGGGRLRRLEIQHYPGMTERAIADMVARAGQRWSLDAALVIHRHGQIAPSEPIMMVATAAPHRRAAFDAADFLMDYLKSRAPFWKKEVSKDGAAWVEAIPEDETALGRWD